MLHQQWCSARGGGILIAVVVVVVERGYCVKRRRLEGWIYGRRMSMRTREYADELIVWFLDAYGSVRVVDERARLEVWVKIASLHMSR